MFIAENIISQAIEYWQAQTHKEDQVLMLCIAEHSDLDVSEMIRAFNEEDIPFFGGLFPKIIYGNRQYEQGAILRILPSSKGIHIIKNDPDSGPDEEALQGLQKLSDNTFTIITLVDGLMKNISATLNFIHNNLGENGSFFGGGAGSLSLQQAPCLFTHEGFIQDAAVLCLVDSESSTGVRHGWEKLHGPLVATKTDRNIIYELNWQNAFEVYHDIVSQDAGESFQADNFFDTSKGYPFGIYREGEEDIVRDPIAVTEEGGLVSVGEVPENAVLHILKGESENLIQAAGKAMADSHREGKNPGAIFLADCISRAIFLEDNFELELNAAQNQISPESGMKLEGILSLGEIASYGDGTLSFYNKTFVISSLYL